MTITGEDSEVASRVQALIDASWTLDNAWHEGSDHEQEHEDLCDALHALYPLPSPAGRKELIYGTTGPPLRTAGDAE